jgi:hypothetical protein
MANRKKQTIGTEVFAMNSIYYVGAEPQFQFAFNASNEAEAKSIAAGWARYQGFDRSDYTVTVATESQTAGIRNEYVQNFR